MSDLENEYMDTGALTEDAVPEPGVTEEPAPVQEPYTEAPGSPSSEATNNTTDEENDGSAVDSGLPHGAVLGDTNETIAGSPPGDPTIPLAE